VVDDLIDRIMVDPRLNANPRVDEAHHRVAPAGFKFLVTEMVCWAAGGPQQYWGRPMGDSHRDLMITEAEWQAFMADFQQTLDKFPSTAGRTGRAKRHRGEHQGRGRRCAAVPGRANDPGYRSSPNRVTARLSAKPLWPKGMGAEPLVTPLREVL